MPNLQFTKTGVTTLTFGRNDQWPRVAQGDENQLTGITQSQLVRIATLNPPTRYLPLSFAQGMLDADYTALGVFLRDPLINFRALAFTFHDVDGTTMMVRYWQGYYSFSKITPLLWQGTLTLRIVS